MLNNLREMKKQADACRPLIEALCTKEKPAAEILLQRERAIEAGVTVTDTIILEIAVQRAAESFAATSHWRVSADERCHRARPKPPPAAW